MYIRLYSIDVWLFFRNKSLKELSLILIHRRMHTTVQECHVQFQRRCSRLPSVDGNCSSSGEQRIMVTQPIRVIRMVSLIQEQ